jgi:hypothetical protein
MEPHVHSESTAQWGRGRMAAHLQATHGMQVPMAWDNGKLHQVHLDAHQAAKRATSTQPEAEEAVPVPRHSHGDIARLHDTAPRSAVIAHLMEVHGLTPDEMSDEIYSQHARAHLTQPTQAKEADMTQTPPAPVPADADDGPRKLYEASDKAWNVSWDDLDQEARDTWRAEDARQTLVTAVVPGSAGYERRKRPVGSVPSREHGDQHAERRIMVDRFTAAMAGLDFERDWAADDGIGANARGALRITFQRAAEQLLYTLERGGLLPFGPLTEAEQANLERLEEEIRSARAVAETEREAGAEARRQMGEQQRSMQDMARALASAEAERDGLLSQMSIDQREHGASLDAVQRALDVARAERDDLARRNAELEAEVQRVGTGNQRNVGSIDALEEQLAEVTDERDRAQQRLMEKLTEVGRMRDERDEARRVLDNTVRRLAERTAVLDTGRSQLTAWITELQQLTPDPTWHEIQASQVAERLGKILGGVASVSTGSDQGGDVPVTPLMSLAEIAERLEGVREEDDLAWARKFAEGGEA